MSPKKNRKPPKRSKPLFPCPVCDQETISEPMEYEICTVCGWEDDPDQIEHPGDTGANPISLNTARRRWRKHVKETPEGEPPSPLFSGE